MRRRPEKATSRSRKPVPTARKVKSRPSRAPATRRLSAAERSRALSQAWHAAVTGLWGSEGSRLGAQGPVAIHGALVTRGRPHWHLVTRGLAATGCELSLRVAREKDEAAPPPWAIALLSGLVAREAGPAPDPLQCLTLSGGLAPGSGTALTALAFAVDPLLPALDAGGERVPVLQAVPVTADEARAVREWSPVGLLEIFSRLDPLLVTDLERASLLESPRARLLIDQRIEREGSSLSAMSAQRSELARDGQRVTWTLSAEAVETLVSLLKGRIGHLRSFTVAGRARVEVVNADAPRLDFAPGRLTVGLSLPAARQIRSLLKARPGTYTFELLPNLAVNVVSA